MTTATVTAEKTFDREAAMVSLLPQIARLAAIEVRRGCPIPQEDLIQAAAVQLWKDIGRFDPSRGYQLCTWAGKRIVGAMKDYMRHHGRMLSGGVRSRRRERSFDIHARRDNGALLFDHMDQKAVDLARQHEGTESFHDMLRGLTKIERLVCVLRFRNDMLMHEIGQSLGISECWVSMILARVIELLGQRMNR